MYWLAIPIFILGFALGLISRKKPKKRKVKTVHKILNPVPRGSGFISPRTNRRPIVRSEEDEWAKEHEL